MGAVLWLLSKTLFSRSAGCSYVIVWLLCLGPGTASAIGQDT